MTGTIHNVSSLHFMAGRLDIVHSFINKLDIFYSNRAIKVLQCVNVLGKYPRQSAGHLKELLPAKFILTLGISEPKMTSSHHYVMLLEHACLQKIDTMIKHTYISN